MEAILAGPARKGDGRDLLANCARRATSALREVTHYQAHRERTRICFHLRVVAFLITLLAQSPPQATATIRLQTAIVSTEDGHRTEARLRAKWEPKVVALAKREADIALERQDLEKESRIRHGIWPFRHAMSAKRKAALQHAIDTKDVSVRRERDDDRADLEKDQTRAVNNIAGKMLTFDRPICKRERLLRGSRSRLAPESNIISGAKDITSEIVLLYERTYSAAP